MADIPIIRNEDVNNIPRYAFLVLNSSIMYKADEILICQNGSLGLEQFVASDGKKYQVDLKHTWEFIRDGKCHIASSLDKELYDLLLEYIKEVSDFRNNGSNIGAFRLKVDEDKEVIFVCSQEEDENRKVFRLILQ